MVTVQQQEHDEIHNRISKAGIKIILPIFKDLIEIGNADGSFYCLYPEETAKYGWQSIDSKMSDEERMEKLKYFYKRMLGIQ